MSSCRITVLTSFFHRSPFHASPVPATFSPHPAPSFFTSLSRCTLPHDPHRHPHLLDSVLDSYSDTDGAEKRASAAYVVAEVECPALLSRCRSLRECICVHGFIIKAGLHGHLLLSNRLLALYSRCSGGAAEARKLFDGMPHRDAATWSGIISAYSRSGDHEEALRFFQRMLLASGSSAANEFVLSSVVRCASSLRALDLGMQAHAHILKRGFGSNTVLGSALLHLYSRCSGLEEAARIFALIDCRDAVSWTAMISALVDAEDWGSAIQMYASMIESGTTPTEFTFAKLLTACVVLGQRWGALLHAHLVLWGLELNLVLKTALVDMYCKCRDVSTALRVFRQTPESDVMVWTALIAGYSQVEGYREAISTFREMEAAGVMPNSFTYAGILSACASSPVPELGRQLHGRVAKAGLEHDASVGNALVDLYAKWSPDLEDPVRAFQRIASPNVVSWTALIAALVRHGRHRDALAALTEMRAAGVEPNSFTLSTLLKGCGGDSGEAQAQVEALAHARKLQAYVLKTSLDSADAAVGNSLVDAYARCGGADEAWAVASTMVPRKDVLTYTSLAKGLNQMGLHRRALALIHRMSEEGVRMDDFSLACFLSAAAGSAAVGSGKQLHCYSVKSGLRSRISVSNGLVDMYGKCGSIDEARSVFMAIQAPNVVSWNGLISALASNGRFVEALSAFEDMRLAGVPPDGITFLLVLYACSHGGLVDAGIEYFNSMEELYGVPPRHDHYVCLVDMLGRAGRLEAAAQAVKTMPFRPDTLIYKTLLASCRFHGNLVLGECMARNALGIDPADPAIYVQLAGIYDDAGRPEWSEQTRRMMKERALRKCPGQSWMEAEKLT
ncbi:pentatricopeptide repeat-containing protein At5g52850, chloroplastic [Phoenix dactylifera]|uniref:Pentatricopeptide repeat-containing protein At5g52850, chloroplastic n=1 Tax=Phoenix dactylifera TaxID=42345 RepID=A0A8B7CL51_PHODC|nr:pentatricopeptide repeat-containing protein At5g52850, chloroplastic [Phoenix dactylifera]